MDWVGFKTDNQIKEVNRRLDGPSLDIESKTRIQPIKTKATLGLPQQHQGYVNAKGQQNCSNEIWEGLWSDGPSLDTGAKPEFNQSKQSNFGFTTSTPRLCERKRVVELQQ